MAKKRPIVHLEGSAKYKKTKAKVEIEVKITDPNYEFGILKDDIRTKRLWMEAPPDDEGWMKLLYSADGPTGDPIPVGKIKIGLAREQLEPDLLDANFRDFTSLALETTK